MVHPSREESFGMSVLESMAMGTPVIGGERAGNVPYLLSDGAGILCDVESVDSLAAAIDLMTANVGLRECVGEAARQRAIESYHRDVVMNLYVEYLVDIAHGGSE
jgi:glycosyltransferase involved in cell wall biosynthesis